jgi:hypothetical protein
MAALPMTSVRARSVAPVPRRTGVGGPSPAPRPETADLKLVPRRRRAAGFAVCFAVLAVALMLGAAVVHTQLSERQLEIDRLEQEVSDADARFEVLRGQRAELRSPGRLNAEAARLGMRPAPTSDFVSIDRWTVARAVASVGIVDSSRTVASPDDPLDQFRTVKEVGAGTP